MPVIHMVIFVGKLLDDTMIVGMSSYHFTLPHSYRLDPPRLFDYNHVIEKTGGTEWERG